jgi:alkaline phosphatase D
VNDENDTPPELFSPAPCGAAYQAYFETMPLRASTMPRGSDMRLYRTPALRRLYSISNVLDTRQYRSKDGVRRREQDELRRLHSPRRARSSVQNRSAGCFDNLADAKAKWTVDLVSRCRPSRAIRRKANPEGRYAMDKVDGYVESAHPGSIGS